jgi:hypothetical protein
MINFLSRFCKTRKSFGAGKWERVTKAHLSYLQHLYTRTPEPKKAILKDLIDRLENDISGLVGFDPAKTAQEISRLLTENGIKNEIRAAKTETNSFYIFVRDGAGNIRVSDHRGRKREFDGNLRILNIGPYTYTVSRETILIKVQRFLEATPKKEENNS